MTPRDTLRELIASLQAAGIDYLPFPAGLPREVPSARRINVPPPILEKKPAPPPTPIPRTPAPTSVPVSVPAKAPPKKNAPVQKEKTIPLDGPLAVLAAEVKACMQCSALVATRTQTVFGEGPLKPPVMFLGEAPNEEEDREGQLFVGQLGELFDRILSACKLSRAEVYIANILKCRLPGKRSSKLEECLNCRPYLERQIDIVRPKAICCLGEIVASRLLGSSAPMSELRAVTHSFLGLPVFCLHHPRSFLNQPNSHFRFEFWEDLKRMLKELGLRNDE